MAGGQALGEVEKHGHQTPGLRSRGPLRERSDLLQKFGERRCQVSARSRSGDEKSTARNGYVRCSRSDEARLVAMPPTRNVDEVTYTAMVSACKAVVGAAGTRWSPFGTGVVRAWVAVRAAFGARGRCTDSVCCAPR